VWSVARTTVPDRWPVSASQVVPYRQSVAAAAAGYGAPGLTTATLSRLTLPESVLARVKVIL
jgi:hypothetical protein